MAELEYAGVASDGKPRLHAPPTFDEGSSITHVHTEADDIMEYLYPFPRDMDLSLGMLKDMGWEIDDNNFPPSCVPTGVSVTPTSGLVTTEGEWRWRMCARYGKTGGKQFWKYGA